MKHIIILCILWLASAAVVTLLIDTPVMAQRTAAYPLVLRGKVRGIKQMHKDPGYVDLEIELDLEFVNTGTQPIIFLVPPPDHQAEIFWLSGISLSMSKLLAQRGGCNSTIWLQSHGPAVSTAPEFQVMAKRLDQLSPPPDLTRRLQPNETWPWQTTAFLRFYSQTPSSVYSAHDLDWEVIGKINTPLWMRLSYEVWSLNLQRADKSLRKRLQKQWKDAGILSIEPDLRTEPIELRLNDSRAEDPHK